MFSQTPTSTLEPAGANVSRTQSLRAQAKLADAAGLGRSSSMKTPGEVRMLQPIPSAVSPPSHPATPHNPYSVPSPPPLSSAAAFPPFQITKDNGRNGQLAEKSDLKRHQSLTQGYGSSSRVRERLERSPAVLTLHQREGFRRLTDNGEQPPTSPIGHSVWSPSHGGDDGWNRPSTQHLQDAFQAMNIGLSQDGSKQTQSENLLQSQENLTPNRQNSLAEEPSWVANLVGHADRISPRPVRTASAPGWPNAAAYLPGQPVPQLWINQPPYPQQMAYRQIYIDNRQPGARTPVHQTAQFAPPYPHLTQQPLYPSPPGTALSPSEDINVIELAKSKGLNPATFDCQPAQARFFVIKSYTVRDAPCRDADGRKTMFKSL